MYSLPEGREAKEVGKLAAAVVVIVAAATATAATAAAATTAATAVRVIGTKAPATAAYQEKNDNQNPTAIVATHIEQPPFD